MSSLGLGQRSDSAERSNTTEIKEAKTQSVLMLVGDGTKKDWPISLIN